MDAETFYNVSFTSDHRIQTSISNVSSDFLEKIIEAKKEGKCVISSDKRG